jgi:hypothetical protein
MLALAVVKPLGYDNALIQSLAVDLAHGLVPYIGSWGNHNLPGIIYIHYISVLLFGPSDLALRLFDSIIQIAFALFFYRFLLRWLKPHTAAISAVLYVAYYVSAGSLLLSEPDLYGAMLVVIAFALLLPPSKWWRLVVGGLCVGAYVIIRPTSLLYVAIFTVYRLFFVEKDRVGHRIMDAAIVLLSGLLPLALFLLYYARIPGGLESMYLTVVRWNIDLYSPLEGGLIPFLEELARRALIIPFAIYAILHWRRTTPFFQRPPERTERILFYMLLVAAFGIAMLMRKYFSYHFAPFFLLLLPLAAVGIEQFATRFKTVLGRHNAILISCFLCTFVTYPPKAPFAFGLGLILQTDPVAFTYQTQLPDSSWGAVPEQATIHYLSKPENAAGLVEICSYDPHLRLHLGRECAGKYPVLVPLGCRTNGDTDAPPRYTDYQVRWQQAYLDSLRRKQPRFLILARGTHYSYLEDPYTSCLRWIPGFDSLLHSAYHYDTAFGGMQVLMHNKE